MLSSQDPIALEALNPEHPSFKFYDAVICRGLKT